MNVSKFVVLVLFCLLTACSQTYIHITNQGFSKEKISAIERQLLALNVKVKHTDIAVPEEFSTTTVTTHPSYRQLSLLQAIESILLAENLSKPQHLTFAQGRHFYNENHIGLYLRNENNTKAVMPPYLRTQYCAFSDATIMFKKNGRFILEYEKGAYEEELALVNGNYIFNGKQLKIKTDDDISQSYWLSRELKQTHMGQRNADVFKPKADTLELAPLNCEFLIIFMD